MLRTLSNPRRALFGQIVRYGVTGGIVTALAAGVYWGLATYAGIAPLLANVAAYLFAAVLGFVMHSRWSFKGHDKGEALADTSLRFFLVSLASLGLNSFWVWLSTGLLGGPTWWPVVPMLLVTPIAVFALNRRFVFGLG